MKTKTIKPAILIHFDPYPIFRQPLWRQGDVVLPTHLPRLERHADVENGDDLRPKLASADVDSRVVGLQAFLENPRHALESAAKTTERRKSRLSVIGRALRGRHGRREVSPSVAAMTESLALVSGLLKRAAGTGGGSVSSTVYAMGEAKVGMVGGVEKWRSLTSASETPVSCFEIGCLEGHYYMCSHGQVAEALENALGLLEELPSGEAGRVGEAERDEFYGFLEKLLLKIRDASEKPGKVLIIPCGWLRRPCSSGGDDLGHCVLLVLQRCRDREEFLMGIVNTGEGLQYHPASLSRLPPNPELPLRQSPLVLTGVNVDRIRSSGFWYLLYRQILYPDPANGPEAFYGLLLPFLNEKPLSANASALFPKWLEHVPIPVAGDRSGAICVERAVRFALVVAGMDAPSASWWSGVGLRRALLDCMNEALQTTQLRSPAPAEFALLQVGISSLARTAAAMRGHEQQKLELQSFIESLDSRAQQLQRRSRSVQPRLGYDGAAAAATGFAGFGRVLLQNVEQLKGEAKFGSLTLPSFPSALPAKIYSATEASEVCHLVRSMVTLMMNQQDRLPHAAASSFALVIHLISRLLPMPLAVDDAQWPKACFWAGDQALTFETKRELLRNLSGLSRGFSASASALSAIHATREMDSARTCVCAAICALMDALLRRPLDLRQAGAGAGATRAVQERHGDLFSLHYAGRAGGPESPCRPFILSSNSFRDISKALLLPQPEMALLRAQALDYFESLERFLDKSSASQSSGGIVFNFDKGMDLTDADRDAPGESHVVFGSFRMLAQAGLNELKFSHGLLVEQLSLSIGLDPSPSAAQWCFVWAEQALTGERPELIDFFPELACLRDAVFLWKVLLLPPGEDADKASRRPRLYAVPLQWRFVSNSAKQRKSRKAKVGEDGTLAVQGFELTGKKAFSSWWATSNWQAERGDEGLQSLKRWITGQDGYKSDFRSISQANPSILSGSPVDCEEDILALQTVPTFGSSLKPSESELLLTYLLAPYMRIPPHGGSWDRGPLILNFFWDKQRMTLLQEPQLQAILEAALFEPGPWLSQKEELEEVPKTIPAASAAYLSTRAGLLFNEMQYSPEPVMASMHRLLRFALEQDPGRAETPREGLILFLVRLAIRVESYGRLVVEQRHRVGRRQVDAKQTNLERIRKGLDDLSKVLQQDILQMLLEWATQAVRRRPRSMATICRIHAHIAFLFKNHVPESKEDIAIFLSSQIFINNATAKSPSESSTNSASLGVGEFELFDLFEMRRYGLAKWLREHRKEASVIMENVEQVVTCQGVAFIDIPNSRSWSELPHEPGNWTLSHELESSQPAKTSYREWLHLYDSSSVVVSINQGRYHCRDAGLGLLPHDVLTSAHLTEAPGGGRGDQGDQYTVAFGSLTDSQVVVREETAHRVCFELVGQKYEVHVWDEDPRLENGPLNVNSLEKVTSGWWMEVLEPILSRWRHDLTFYKISEGASSSSSADLWLLALAPKLQLEIGLWRQTPLVEIYDLPSHGRQIYRRLIFTSDMTWSLHSPEGPEAALYSVQSAGWSLGKGILPSENSNPGQSVRIFRYLSSAQGREEFVPAEMLRGLLPDALLERYKFWRHKGESEALLAEERFEVDQPTRLRVKFLSPQLGLFPEALTTVKRCKLRRLDPTSPRSNGGLEEGAADFLVNTKLGMNGLTELLARLENLSHILAWSDRVDGKGGVSRIELPRLSLSFTRDGGGRFYCDQLAGHWILENPESTSVPVHKLLAHFGGGSVLLGTGDGNLAILVSALAQPLRPWALGGALGAAGSGPAEEFLPGQLLLRRASGAWVERLREGSRYYCYPLHRCSMMVFTPTPAAALYLLLCRYLTWHFEEVVAMAGAICEVVRPEEQQLWECLSVLQGECHADAVACRLQLTLASLPFGKHARPPWDVAKQLLEYSAKRHLVSAGCALSVSQELLLHNLPELQAASSPLLGSRRAVLECLVAAQRSGQQSSLVIPLGPQLDDLGFDRQRSRELLGEVGFFTRVACSMQGLTYTRPEGERPVLEGSAALRFLDALFGRMGAAGTGGLLAFRGSFFLLYELFTGTLEVKLFPDDNPGILASALLRLMFGAENFTMDMEQAVLRALDSTPELSSEMPLWGSSATKRTWQVGNLIRLDHDSSSRLLRSAMKHLRQQQKYLHPVRRYESFSPADGKLVIDPHDIDHKRHWSPPLTQNVNCQSRGFSYGSQDSLKCLGSRPLAQLLQSSCGEIGEQSEELKQDQDVLSLRSWLQKLRSAQADPNFRFTSLPPGQRTLERLLLEL
ncbi:unnamed protein product [Cladocopium goreaui]|uniref:Ubiquitinyl hydrolase 1 n=1 Tax=Cladocopium goreaui TaxID=2562237 RepID=A0A9P1DU53_9DINO|nr:unnamed protein product [Cladocopium goreaui]